MILLIDTSTPLCKLAIVRGESITWHEWQADRQLARGLLQYITVTLGEYDASLTDLTGIGVYRGPGSFTGLRIGSTVANTLADGLKVAIVGSTGQSWVTDVCARLNGGENDKITLPEYGGDAHITKPRK